MVFENEHDEQRQNDCVEIKVQFNAGHSMPYHWKIERLLSAWNSLNFFCAAAGIAANAVALKDDTSDKCSRTPQSVKMRFQLRLAVFLR